MSYDPVVQRFTARVLAGAELRAELVLGGRAALEARQNGTPREGIKTAIGAQTGSSSSANQVVIQ
jgi:hypothetical protein